MKAILLAVTAMLTIGAAPVNWAKMVTRAPNGAYVLGNPKAKVRLVEYMSYSCNHCADFTAQASAPLRGNYVAKGNVAVELRNAVRDRYDFAAALLARCGGAKGFFAQSEALFAGQEALMAKAQAAEATSSLADDASTNDALVTVAEGSGMIDYMTARGLAPAAAKACLINKSEQDIVLAMTKEAWETRKIAGTPSFLINGRDTGPSVWSTVEPKLRAAVGKR